MVLCLVLYWLLVRGFGSCFTGGFLLGWWFTLSGWLLFRFLLGLVAVGYFCGCFGCCLVFGVHVWFVLGVALWNFWCVADLEFWGVGLAWVRVG